MSAPDGGMAFPGQRQGWITRPLDGGYHTKEFGMVHYDGMSLRDYFAAKAMTVLIPKTDRDRTEWTVKKAYEIADAMLAERAKEKK